MSDDNDFESASETLASAEDYAHVEETPTLASANEAEEPSLSDIEKASAPSELATVRYSARQLQRSRDVLTRLYAIRRAARFYPFEHPAVVEAVMQFAEVVRGYHNEGVDVFLSFFEGEILLGDQLLPEESVMFDQLIRDMMSIGVGSLVIRRGFSNEELSQAVQIISTDARALEEAGGLAFVVAHANLHHISVGVVQVVERVDHQTEGVGEEPKEAYGGAVSLLREIDRLMRVNRHMSASKVKGVVRSLVDNVLSNQYAMLQLTGLKNYDEYTFYHSANVAILSLALGSMITNDYRFLSSLGVGALLHDIGKLSVDLEILNKPGALSPDEWAAMREHPVRGAQIVSQLPGVDKSSVVMILEHHMRYDSTGYPHRKPVRSQHLASRIVAVADSYDAMTSRRSYSAARVQDDAMALIVKSAGSSLDPVLVRLFVRLMGVYPPRSVVRLSEGQIAVVVAPSRTDPLRPLVRVIATDSGEFMEPVDIDLTEVPELSVRGCIDPRLLNIDVDAYFA